jgi:hypothetical protein
VLELVNRHVPSALNHPRTRSAPEQRLAAFLARQHYSRDQKPAQLLAKLRHAPEGRVGEVELNARRELVLGLVTAIKALIAQIKALNRQIATAVREHPDGEIFRSLFKDPSSVVTPPSCCPRSETVARATRSSAV